MPAHSPVSTRSRSRAPSPAPSTTSRANPAEEMVTVTVADWQHLIVR